MTSSTTQSDRKTILVKAVGIGMLAGFLSGLFGVGGGILMVPMIMLLLKFNQKIASGTSLAAVLPIALSGLVGYQIGGKIDWPVGILISIGAIVGAQLGAKFLHHLPTYVITILFIFFLLLSAARLFFPSPDAAGSVHLTIVSVLALIGLGLLSGILAGLLGVGGGIILVPAMIVFASLGPAVAKGTSLVVMIPTAISGTWRNVRNGNTDLPVAAALGIAGMITAFAGAAVSVRMSDELSNILFATLLLAVATKLALGLRQQRAEHKALTARDS